MAYGTLAIAIASIVVAAISLFVAIKSFNRTKKTQDIQDRVNELDIRIKEIELKHLEKENEPKACIEAKIITYTKHDHRIRVSNNGNVTVYNVNISIDDNIGIFITNKDILPFEILEVNNSFDIKFMVAWGAPSKFEIKIEWENSDGIKSEDVQIISRY